MGGSWADLRLPYFERECRLVLDEVMSREGFESVGADELGVTYLRNHCYVGVSYLIEDAPDYSPVVTVGFLAHRADGGREVDGVGLWRAIPETHAARGYGLWEFSSEQELRVVMERVRDELIVPIALPLARDRAGLSELLDIQRREIEEEYLERTQESALEKARAAYDRGELEAALDLYSSVSPERLLRSDRKKMEIARRRSRSDPSGLR